jgi:hypothetical protein
MKAVSNIFPTAGIAPFKLLFGSAVIFASMAVAGQAQSVYPETVPQAQTADVVRPTASPFMNGCTQLETAAGMVDSQCGTLTLSEVVVLMNAFQYDEHNE